MLMQSDQDKSSDQDIIDKRELSFDKYFEEGNINYQAS